MAAAGDPDRRVRGRRHGAGRDGRDRRATRWSSSSTGSPPARASSSRPTSTRRAPRCTTSSRSGASAPGRVVVEEHLVGEELSLLALCDGGARDRRWRRPRTSSGSSTATRGRTPAAWAPTRRCPGCGDIDEIVASVHQPVVDELARRGTPFHGVLYAGLMLTAAGPRVLEFNTRFGDPETQAVLPRLRGDLLAAACATRRGLAGSTARRWTGTPRAAVTRRPGQPWLPRLVVVGRRHHRRRRGSARRRDHARRHGPPRRRRDRHGRRAGPQRDGAGRRAVCRPRRRVCCARGRSRSTGARCARDIACRAADRVA